MAWPQGAGLTVPVRGIHLWEASTNGTHSAVDKVPKDIVICDWHYNKAYETARFFAEKGFDVVACPWRKPAVALRQLELVRAVPGGPDASPAGHALGVVQTTWCGFTPFLAAYRDLKRGSSPGDSASSEAAQCFVVLMKAARDEK